MYHAIVIEESLKEKNILDNSHILRTKVGERWHLHVIEVEDPSEFIEMIQNAMVTEKSYYFHIYNDDSFLSVVFKDKAFNLDPNDKNTWLNAQKYGGEKLGIPPDELDFQPNNFTQEDTWYAQE